MALYTTFSLLVLLVACTAYLNHLTLKLQPTIAIMLAGTVMALGLLLAGQMQWIHANVYLMHTVRHLHFHDLLINGMLSFLLFAGALNVDMHALRQCQWEVATLATVSTISSCILIAAVFHTVLAALGLPLNWLHCLLFGALISPTDPIAVLATFKKLKAPRKLHAIVAGESLFNDGVGVVLFLTFYQLSFGQHVTLGDTAHLFFRQTVGGIAYGALLGICTTWLLRPIKDSHIAILVTLSLVTAGYMLAFTLDISGPLAMVMAGLILGKPAEEHKKNEPLFQFWDIIDELLNALLFFMIGIELLVIDFSLAQWGATLLAIPLVLIVRAITVAAPMQLFKRSQKYCPWVNSLLIWGGLRGGLALALAMALPYGQASQVILPMTFAVVFFAVVVQGLTTPKLLRLSQSTINT